MKYLCNIKTLHLRAGMRGRQDKQALVVSRYINCWFLEVEAQGSQAGNHCPRADSSACGSHVTTSSSDRSETKDHDIYIRYPVSNSEGGITDLERQSTGDGFVHSRRSNTLQMCTGSVVPTWFFKRSVKDLHSSTRRGIWMKNRTKLYISEEPF